LFIDGNYFVFDVSSVCMMDYSQYAVPPGMADIFKHNKEVLMVLLPFAVARGAPCRRVAMLMFCFLLLQPLWSVTAQIPSDADGGWSSIADAPDTYQIQIWLTLYKTQNPGFSAWSCALGDINGDGYDDFAVSSKADTTFIFLGGDPLSKDPVLMLPGGGSALIAADFNNDGRMDIANAVRYANREMDPDRRGCIRIYYQRAEEPWFAAEPDVLLRGDSGKYWGSWSHQDGELRRPSLQALDYNGDGWMDLLTTENTGQQFPRRRMLLFFGGPTFPAAPSVRIDCIHALSNAQTDSPWDVMTGDINGDGCDDFMVHVSFITDAMKRVYAWDLYLGNRSGLATRPSRVLRSDSGWVPKMLWSAIYDINGDGCDDIVDGNAHRKYGDPLVFLGSAELPETILPNDSIRNPWTDVNGLIRPIGIHPVGDINGDGTRDLFISWVTLPVPDGSLYYLFPMSNAGLIRQPTGHFGTIVSLDNMKAGAYDIGDVNGDGIDDIIVLGKGGSQGPLFLDHKFQIYLGTRKLLTDVAAVPRPAQLDLTLYPNPVTLAAGAISVTVSGTAASPLHLEIRDMLGRVLATHEFLSDGSTQTYLLPIAGLVPGNYQLSLRQGNNLTHRTFTVL
jgi:hypothetical protein